MKTTLMSLITALLLFSSMSIRAVAQQNSPPCMPFKTLTDSLKEKGFLPIFGSNNEKAGTIVFIQAQHKAIAVVVFDTNDKACLVMIQENLRVHNENFEAIASKLIGTKT